MGQLLKAIIRSKGSYRESLQVLEQRRCLRRFFGVIHRYADEAKGALNQLANARTRTF